MRDEMQRLDAWSRARNWRLFGFATEQGLHWRRRSREHARTPMVPVERAELDDAFSASFPDSPDALDTDGVNRSIARAADEATILWDSPWLVVFATTADRMRQLEATAPGAEPQRPLAWRRGRNARMPAGPLSSGVEPQRPLDWWRKPFSIHDLTMSATSSVEARREHRLGANAIKAAVRWILTRPTSCPTPLRRGGEDGPGGKAAGSGLLITDGEHYGVLTAGHVLDPAANGAPTHEPIWAVIMRPPRPAEAEGDKGRAPAIALRASQLTVLTPKDNHGRTDVGIAHLRADDVRETCAEFNLEPLNVADADERIASDPLAGIHVAIGAPEDRQMVDGRGRPFTETACVPPCRSYRAGGMAYIGYGANGRDEIGVNRNRNWSGFSGAPVWSLEPCPGALDKLSRDRADVSFDDFQNARPVAMLCYQNAGPWGEGLGPPEGFAHEVYAHRIDARFLRIAGRLLSFEDRDDNRVRRVTERHVQ